jgi:hypothetical protein
MGIQSTRKKEKKMTEGFSKEKIDVTINKDEVKNLLKKYKKIKKYQRSPLFEVKTMDGTEKLISGLLKEFEDGQALST